jgi:hypothetical protein
MPASSPDDSFSLALLDPSDLSSWRVSQACRRVSSSVSSAWSAPKMTERRKRVSDKLWSNGVWKLPRSCTRHLVQRRMKGNWG